MSSEEFARHRNLCLQLVTKLEIIQITESVLNLSESSFSLPLGSLDAIHLASAILWHQKYREQIPFLTHDRELAIEAISHGFEVHGAP